MIVFFKVLVACWRGRAEICLLCSEVVFGSECSVVPNLAPNFRSEGALRAGNSTCGSAVARVL